MTKLLDVEGIGETYALKLKGAGIGSLEALLEKGATPRVARNWLKPAASAKN